MPDLPACSKLRPCPGKIFEFHTIDGRGASRTR